MMATDSVRVMARYGFALTSVHFCIHLRWRNGRMKMANKKHDCENCIHKVVCALWEIQNELCDSECSYYQPTLAPQSEWVSVEERLPTIEKDYGSVSVNVFNGKSVLPMDYESSMVRGKKVFRWKYLWNRIYDGEPITHWRPLPEPPAKEE